MLTDRNLNVPQAGLSRPTNAVASSSKVTLDAPAPADPTRKRRSSFHPAPSALALIPEDQAVEVVAPKLKRRGRLNAAAQEAKEELYPRFFLDLLEVLGCHGIAITNELKFLDLPANVGRDLNYDFSDLNKHFTSRLTAEEFETLFGTPSCCHPRFDGERSAKEVPEHIGLSATSTELMDPFREALTGQALRDGVFTDTEWTDIQLIADPATMEPIQPAKQAIVNIRNALIPRLRRIPTVAEFDARGAEFISTSQTKQTGLMALARRLFADHHPLLAIMVFELRYEVTGAWNRYKKAVLAEARLEMYIDIVID